MGLVRQIHESVSKVLKRKTATRTQGPAHLADGARAEALAERHLVGHGLTMIARNLRSRWGEIDLIAADGEAIVFVEVRLRSDARYGGAAASISAAKQMRLVRTAGSFLVGAGRAYANRPCRFDVVLLDRLDAGHIEWIRGAFDAF
jgi:putative endonuclease